MDYKANGQQIIRLRKARGWSRRELARRADVSDTTLKYMESGERNDGAAYAPSETTLRNVAMAFGGTDAAGVLRMYGRDDMARFVEGNVRQLRPAAADPIPELTADQRRALDRIMEELTRLLSSANSHTGLSVSSPSISHLRSRSVA